MAYRPRTSQPLLIVRAAAQTVRLEVWDDSAIAEPTAGTFTLYDDSDAVIQTGAVTVAGRVATAQVLAATVPATLSYSESWRAVWSLTLGGSVEVFDQPAGLVRSRFRAPIVPGDLAGRHPEFGPGRELDPGQDATGTATPGDWIADAEATVEAWLWRAGRRPWLIIDAWQLREACLCRTLELAFRWASTFGQDGSRLAEQAAEYGERFDTEMAKVQFRYDQGQTGRPSEARRVAAQPILILSGNRRAGSW